MARRAIPKPGHGVRGSTTGRPLMAAMDLLGRRWALRILWELRVGPTGARALLAKCDGMSSSVLYDRLRELAAAGLVERTHDDQYVLSELGMALGSAMEPLDTWAKSWATSLRKTPRAV
jgi:DNA-binding HxlR family transcriptional regulator